MQPGQQGSVGAVEFSRNMTGNLSCDQWPDGQSEASAW